MIVRIGNPHPIEHVHDNQGNQVVRMLKEEGVTSFIFPEELPLNDALLGVIDAMRFHIDRSSSPVWIESDNPDLQNILCKYYNINPSVQRPGDWGLKKVMNI